MTRGSTTVRVDVAQRPYDIVIGRGLNAGQILPKPRTVLLVMDSHIAPLQGDAVQGALEKAGHRVICGVVPAGEESKSLCMAERLYAAAIEGGLDRKSAVVALGGGMVGDLAGFVAATLFRGIDLIQIPTTLLALVDSSVGGKTAINLAHGKNLVGVFHQPMHVLADLDRLITLPDREYRSGIAEVIKYGIIRDATLFERLERDMDRLVARESAVLEPVVARCCELKAEVVALDERESGLRAILNFGHTLGHALEQTTAYGSWLHGEAVASGMVFAALVSARRRGLPATELARIRALIHKSGLPVSSQAPDGTEKPWVELRKAMESDKKSIGRVPRFVLAKSIGSVEVDCEVGEDVLTDAYKEWSCQS